MKYEFLLIDADDTLFDFQNTAKLAFKQTMKKLNVPYEDSLYPIYAKINQDLWDLYSLGKVSKQILKVKRFVDFGKEIGVEIDSQKAIPLYEEELSKTAILINGAEETLSKLKSLPVKLYIITNGTASVQRGRLALSGLDKYFDGIFISDEIGYSKPAKEFLNFVKDKIDGFCESLALIIGDSLVSDIPLGLENGIDVCLYNPNNIKVNLPINYQIDDLLQILDVVKK